MTLTAAQQAAADALDAAAAAVRALANDTVPVPAPLSFSKGDRVRLVGKSAFGYDGDGKLGTVRDPNFESGQLTVEVDGDSGTRIYRTDRVVKFVDAPGVVRTKTTGHSLKTGDQVEVVESRYSHSSVGKVGELCVEHDGSFGVVVSDGYGYVAVDAVKLAATEKRHAYRADKAKLGDLIRIVSVNGRNGVARPGDPVGEEKRVMAFPSGYNGYVIVEGDWGIDAYDIVSRADEKPAAKVGDRVTVTEVAPAYMQERNGFTGIVQEARLDGKYLVAFDGYRMRGTTIVATKVSPLATDAPSNPARPEPKPFVPEPAKTFEVYYGDTFNVEYLGKDAYDPIRVDVNDQTSVWVSNSKLDELIKYLEAVKAHRTQ